MLQEVWTVQNYMMLQYKPFLELSQNINVTKDRWLPILPPLHGWMMNEENDEIVAAPFGGGGGGGDTFITVINQPAHGFTAGQVVFFNGTDYQLANATNAGEAEVIGLVESVVNANNFNLLFGGMTDGLTGLTPGGVYFLSDTVDGELTLVEPSTPGHVSKPLVIAVNSTTGFFYNMRGKIINSPSFPWNPVASDTIMVADNNYFTTGGGLLNLYLPPIAAVGTIIRIAGYNSLGWHVVQDVGQSIDLGIDTTTVGVAGYIESITPKDTIELLCVVANTHWITLSSVGNITVF
jgi:hypothetical protein